MVEKFLIDDTVVVYSSSSSLLSSGLQKQFNANRFNTLQLNPKQAVIKNIIA